VSRRRRARRRDPVRIGPWTDDVLQAGDGEREDEPGVAAGLLHVADQLTDPGEPLVHRLAIGGHTAVANAVADAIEHLGVRVTRTPLKPSTVWELIRTSPGW